MASSYEPAVNVLQAAAKAPATPNPQPPATALQWTLREERLGYAGWPDREDGGKKVKRSGVGGVYVRRRGGGRGGGREGGKRGVGSRRGSGGCGLA